MSVGNRLGRLRKKYNLTISSTVGGSPIKGGAVMEATATPTNTPRKRIRPAKSLGKPKTSESDDTKIETPSKSAKKTGGGRKRKASAIEEDAGNEEKTVKAEVKDEF